MQSLHSFNLEITSGGPVIVIEPSLWNEECFIKQFIFHLLGVLVLRKSSKILLCVSLRRNQDRAPRLHYCFSAAPPLSLHPLPSLISNCLNLPFGTQGRSRRPRHFFLQTRNTVRLLYPGEPHRVLLGFRECSREILKCFTL